MKKIGILAWYSLDNEIDKIPWAYLKALEDSWDFLVFIIPCISNNIDILINEMDCFLIPWGQSDVDPSIYKEENQSSNWINLKNDKLLISVILKIIWSKKPILWICKWAQLINVAFGGSLIQDISNTQYSFDCIHNVSIDKNSILFNIYNKTTVVAVNSLHHQAVKKVGDGLFAIAHNEEWIIEAIQDKSWKVLWVQWHPEYLKQHSCLFEQFFG